MSPGNITAKLIVVDAAGAIAFYEQVFGLRERDTHRDADGTILHAILERDGAMLALAEENPASQNLSPDSLGGSPVILQWECDDPDDLRDRAVQRGATEIFPVADRDYGRRDGRLRDPFGHVWIVSRPLDASR